MRVPDVVLPDFLGGLVDGGAVPVGAAGCHSQREPEGILVKDAGPGSLGDQVGHLFPAGLEDLLAVPALATQNAVFPTERGAFPARHVRSSRPWRVPTRSSPDTWPGRPSPARRCVQVEWCCRVVPGTVLPLLDCVASQLLRPQGQDSNYDGAPG